MPAPEDVLDPRAEPPAVGEAVEAAQGVRPVVALPRAGLPPWLLGLMAVAAAIILFVVLEMRRTAPGPELARTAEPPPAPPPPLYIPAQPAPLVRIEAAPAPAAVRVAPAPRPVRQQVQSPPPQPQIVYVPQPQQIPEQLPPPPIRVDAGSAMVVDTTGASGPAGTPGAPPSGPVGLPGSQFTASLGGRERSGRLANLSGTVQQGTLIPAVLETAFNSNHPGFARAIVSRDVHGFDGKRVLIPRGSRLIGEYRSDTAQGQKRALITWQRLVRPDGVTIALGSPATDPLGRGGVKAKVDSHFFERFAGAILRSTVDIGLTLAALRAGNNNNGVLVALPGTLSSGVGQLAQPQNIRPTLKVPAGRSISVFVARDLDFGGPDAKR